MDLLKIASALKEGRTPGIGLFPDSLLDFGAGAASIKGRFTGLSPVERVLATVRHKEPDRVPVTPIANAVCRSITGTSFSEYSKDPKKAADVLCAGLSLIGGDFIILMIDLSIEAEGFGQAILYPENSTAHPDYDNPLIKSVDDYYKIKPKPLSECSRMQDFIRLCEILSARVGFKALISGFVFGPLGVLAMMRGAENLFKDCIENKNAVMKALESITETLVEYTEAQCHTGVSAICIDTLFASHNGLSKKLWEEIEGPFAKEITSVIKKHGLITGIHNCGHGLYFDSQIKFMEPDAISFAHLPDDCYSLSELKNRYGKYLTLVGCLETPLLVSGTPLDVKNECDRLIDVLGPGGGFILAPGCEYPPNANLVNAFAIVKAAEKYKKGQNYGFFHPKY